MAPCSAVARLRPMRPHPMMAPCSGVFRLKAYCKGFASAAAGCCRGTPVWTNGPLRAACPVRCLIENHRHAEGSPPHQRSAAMARVSAGNLHHNQVPTGGKKLAGPRIARDTQRTRDRAGVFDLLVFFDLDGPRVAIRLAGHLAENPVPTATPARTTAEHSFVWGKSEKGNCTRITAPARRRRHASSSS